MRKKYLLTFFILFIIFSSSTFASTASSSVSQEEDKIWEKVLDALFRLRFKLGLRQYVGRYFNYQLMEPTVFRSYPEVVEVEYLNETQVIIGAKNPKNKEEWLPIYQKIAGFDWGWIYSAVTFRFDLEFPENISKDAFSYRFEPESLTIGPNTKNLDWVGVDLVLKTNLTITLKPSNDPNLPIQDIILYVKVTRTDFSHINTLLRLPDYLSGRNFKNFQEELDEVAAFGNKSFWSYPINRLKYPVISGPSLWLANKQQNRPIKHVYVDSRVPVMLRVKKDHFAEIAPPKPVKIHPNEILSVPVDVKNLGSHIDTFNFRVTHDDEELKIAQPTALTLEPGEEKQAYVTISAPPRLYDMGKTVSLNIEAYSIDEPDLTFSNKLTVTSEGVYVSVGIAYYLALALITLLIIIALIVFILRKLRGSFGKKPNKPWDIPEEKEHLEKLKKKDKKAYKKELKMMEEEYGSALLWYKYYVSGNIKQRKENKLKQKQKKIKEAKKEKQEKIKEAEKIKKDKTQKKKVRAEEKADIKATKKEEKEPEKPKFKEIEPEEPEIKEETTPVIDEKEEEEKRKKEQVLLRIRREQERQKRKFGKSS
ncbi:MAG: hypothetical protein KAR55_01040 [Thermoplasmatales archaeon]|nr:hypothetical protein [Thermoplasmatales archaeon]